MGYEDVYNINTGLSLGLGLLDKPEIEFDQPHHHQGKKNLSLKFDHFPFLTLGLPCEKAIQIEATKVDGVSRTVVYRQASSLSEVSSYSNSSTVKERELSQEDRETEKVLSSRASEDIQDDQEGCARKKLRLTKEQSNILEDGFKKHSSLNHKQKQALAKNLNLRPRQVEVWFQNRRARTKLKQTEVDCELLKKCCEALTDENRRLQKELQELRRLKLSVPCYMQLPAAMLTMCPQCERIGGGGGGGENSSKTPFPIGTRSHFYNPFNHPSAAC
ncbi:homeobox-leucine zipper protein HAT22-like [Cornus florida]|uniref:homeobox-leucine zipper protein HAT22-like n=1 Tax=Cornus florida TaxID=4283 RepID=UPI00289D7941|nr:homeobox-leucine zipper protein HAT22-like [Cornus florida]